MEGDVCCIEQHLLCKLVNSTGFTKKQPDSKFGTGSQDPSVGPMPSGGELYGFSPVPRMGNSLRMSEVAHKTKLMNSVLASNNAVMML